MTIALPLVQFKAEPNEPHLRPEHNESAPANSEERRGRSCKKSLTTYDRTPG